MKKIRISELDPGNDLIGLWTLGTNKNNESVKVSLEFIQDKANAAGEAAEKATKATDAAVSAASAAAGQTREAKTATDRANTAAQAAETATADTLQATKDSTAQTASAKTATDAANTAAKKVTDAITDITSEKEKAIAAADNANAAATACETATAESVKQTKACKDETDLANEIRTHPNKMLDNGNWGVWNTDKDTYEDSNIIARGGVIWPTFFRSNNKLYIRDYGTTVAERVVKYGNKLLIRV